MNTKNLQKISELKKYLKYKHENETIRAKKELCVLVMSNNNV